MIGRARAIPLAVVLLAPWPSAAAEPPPPAEVRAATPDAGPPEPAGLPFGADSVQAVAESHQPEVTSCYEERLAQGKDVRGEVVVGFVIGKDGRATQARVKKSTLGDREVEACVVRAVGGWTFPRPATPQPVTIPFRFDEIGHRAAGAPEPAGR